jgi:AraC-like DNA-binding protein
MLALLTFLILYFKLPDNSRELFTFTNLAISAFQAFLFANALITLLNPKFVTKRYLSIQLIPFLVLASIFGVSSILFGNPVIAHFNEIGMHLNNPTLWVRFVFFGLYCFQLIFYTVIYFNQEKKYRVKAMDYFSDNVWLRLSWVRVAFISALIIGVVSLISYLFAQKWDWIFISLYSIFYFGFALQYIKYNKIYTLIEPIQAEPEITNRKPRTKMEWPGLKQQILQHNYYLESGINIEDIALRLKIGRTTLSTFINREEGVNFNTWINTLRIEQAKKLLLENPNLPLSNISEKVGYSEQANFSRQFRQITGYAPTLWRQTELNTPR